VKELIKPHRIVETGKAFGVAFGVRSGSLACARNPERPVRCPVNRVMGSSRQAPLHAPTGVETSRAYIVDIHQHVAVRKEMRPVQVFGGGVAPPIDRVGKERLSIDAPVV